MASLKQKQSGTGGQKSEIASLRAKVRQMKERILELESAVERIDALQWWRSRGGRGGNSPPKFQGGGHSPPLALNYNMNKFNLLFLLQARVLNHREKFRIP